MLRRGDLAVRGVSGHHERDGIPTKNHLRVALSLEEDEVCLGAVAN